MGVFLIDNGLVSSKKVQLSKIECRRVSGKSGSPLRHEKSKDSRGSMVSAQWRMLKNEVGKRTNEGGGLR